MTPLIAGLLAVAVAVAISPLSIVAVIIMATSGKGRTNGSAFIAGSSAFMIGFLLTLVLLGRTAEADDAESGAHIAVDVVEILLGCALLGLAVLQWRRRSRTTHPAWLRGIDEMTIPKAFLLGVLLAGPLSPKDLPLLVAAGGQISQASLAAAEIAAVILVFVLISLSAVAVPWLVSVIAPGGVERRLSGARQWLLTNHSTIMTVLFLVLGAKLIGSGVVDLTT
ncbi:GAP family protein [Microbacterium xanthum]|uniref:GAP family protein n=1 Tax=Microbacterium xanthum TaxID=3079794 RepID=UPI002AD2954A|nr:MULTISPECIES: GAP family protein [unclassified Microbacterium]MDZ8171540.1 GAP family protein [Microbacterium sp. KSW-48]MDZ8200421.1 GAP family protein [Microbacterium sp. SSW1-59]